MSHLNDKVIKLHGNKTYNGKIILNRLDTNFRLYEDNFHMLFRLPNLPKPNSLSIANPTEAYIISGNKL